jgi:hypothetical protein
MKSLRPRKAGIASLGMFSSEERFLEEGKPDIKKMDPIVFTMTDNRYWNVGEYLGKAWSAGEKMNVSVW